MAKSIIERFTEKFIPEPNSGCWLWLSSVAERDYGRFRINGVQRPAHVVSYELHLRPVPPGLELDHLCRVHCCVNPLHLEAVTHQENIRRGRVSEAARARGRRITHCPRGHPYDAENTLYNKRRQKRSCRQCHRERADARRREQGVPERSKRGRYRTVNS